MTHDAKLTFAKMMRTSLPITCLAGSIFFESMQAETVQSVLCDVTSAWLLTSAETVSSFILQKTGGHTKTSFFQHKSKIKAGN